MPVSLNQSQIEALAFYNRLGIRVDRASATLPASTATAYYTITGGRVMVTLLLGQVTTLVQTQANAAKWTSTPTTGSAVDVCATKDITGLEAGGLLVVNGTAATAMTQANAGAIIAGTVPFIVAAGVLKFDCAATNTGATKWSLFYLPVDDGAFVVTA
jgi:hypothetical protein